jgi:uncharacterized membrane protein SpoIIM required for sporulation
MIKFKFYRQQANSAAALREVTQTPLRAVASRAVQALMLVGIVTLGLLSVSVVLVLAMIVGVALALRRWWAKGRLREPFMARNFQQHLADQR